MPSQELQFRPQVAVYWARTGDDPYGEPLHAAPVELAVRWETKRREARKPDGTPIVLDASVVVGQRVEVGSLVWLGELADWYGTGSGDVDAEVMQVVTYDEVPDLKGRVSLRRAGLQRFRGTLPAEG